MIRLVLLIFVLGSFNVVNGQRPKKFKLPSQLTEVSGLFVADKDTLWWHNDGGHPAELLATNTRGQLCRILPLPQLQNKDWEDIADAPDGTLYIGDFGNNYNNRKDLKIYTYHPETQQIDSISFSFPDQGDFPPVPTAWNFDTEAMIFFQDSLHLFSKNTLKDGNYYTKHYVIPARPGTYQATLRDSIYLKNRIVTGAAISPDGKIMALLSYRLKLFLGFIPLTGASVFYFKDFDSSDFLKGKGYKTKVPAFILSRQYESIDFLSNEKIYVASEKTLFFKARAKLLTPKARHFKNSRTIKALE